MDLVILLKLTGDRGAGVVPEGSSGVTEVQFRKGSGSGGGKMVVVEERSSSVPVQFDKHGNTVQNQYSACLLDVEHRRTLPRRG